MIGSSLLRYQDKQKFLIVDGESNGLNLARSQPWQIAYVVCTNKVIEEAVVRYPKWDDFTMSDEAAQVTRFNMKDYLSRAEPADEVLKDFEAILFDPEYLILGHNLLGFDVYLINTWRRLCGRKEDWSFVPRIVDTLCLSRAYRFQIAPDRNDFLGWQYKMLTMRSRSKGMGASLGAMAREFGIEYDERKAHDAGVDIGYNHEVFKRLIWEIEV